MLRRAVVDFSFYKQVCRAGQPGMAVAKVLSNDSEVSLIAFASNGTTHPDALIVINIAQDTRDLSIQVQGTAATTFQAYRTSPGEDYVSLGDRTRDSSGIIAYQAPPGSVTTFYAC
jgi:hypothetical protein